MSAARIARAALAAALVLGAPNARGALDPDRAHEDVEHARASNNAFCTHPAKPILGRARELCGHARAVPNCEALALACDEELPTPKAPWTPPPWLLDVAVAAVWVVLAALIAAAAGFAAWLLVRARRDRAAAGASKGAEVETSFEQASAAAPPSDAELLLARAEALAKDGALDAALATYLRASLVALDARGAIALRDDRTNGEYVRACVDGDARAELRDVVREVERVRFGHASATHELVSRVGRRAAALVRAALVLGTLLLLPLACDSRGVPGGADDPAGTELLEDVLEAQGVTVRSLARPLAQLPIPEDEDTPLEPRAVLIDLARTPVDADTGAHLSAWVEAGGTLITAGGTPPVGDLERAAATDGRVIVEGVAEAGMVLDPHGFESPSAAHGSTCSTVATVGQGTPFAISCAVGDGRVMAIAEDDLVANVGFARGANAAATLGILAHLAPSEIAFARRDDGVAPPSSPLASLDRAGLRLGLWHALAAALLLFWAVGARLARPLREPPPARRAFAEHVEATGALYARARVAPRALASYVRFVDEHVRAAPGASIPSALATRTGAPLSECERVWSEAHDPEPGTELRVLGRLHALVSRARRA